MKWSLPALLLVSLAGCNVPFLAPAPPWDVAGTGEGPTLWLNYTLENLGSETRFADLGPHCGTARPFYDWVRDGDSWTTRDRYDAVMIDSDTYRGLGAKRPILIVDHQASPWSDGFATTGTEGFPATPPFLLDPMIRDETGRGTATPIARIDAANGEVKVDGEPVSLPHSWTRTETGNWSATFELQEGPRDVKLFRLETCA